MAIPRRTIAVVVLLASLNVTDIAVSAPIEDAPIPRAGWARLEPNHETTTGRPPVKTRQQRYSEVPLVPKCSLEFLQHVREDQYLQLDGYQLSTYDLQFVIRPPQPTLEQGSTRCHMTSQDFENKLNASDGPDVTVFFILQCQRPGMEIVFLPDTEEGDEAGDRKSFPSNTDAGDETRRVNANDDDKAGQAPVYPRYVSYLRVERCRISLGIMSVVARLTDLRVVIMYDSGIWDFSAVKENKSLCHGFRNVVALAIMNDWSTQSYLHDFQRCTGSLDNVIEMALNNDSLTSFPDELKYVFPNLTSVELNNNSLSSPWDFPWKSGFYRLPRNLARTSQHDYKYRYSGALRVPGDTFRREFLLDGNQITNLTHFRFGSDFLYVSLQRNRLRNVSVQTFDGLTCLQFLSLAYNELESLPDGVFSKLGNLTRLDLQHNQLRELPRNIFKNMQNLEQLNLQDNRLTALQDGLFASLERLKVILLGNNYISVASDGAFSSQSIMLGLMDLQRNPLREIPLFVFLLSGLERVNLDETEIRALDFVKIDHLTRMAHLFEVQRNPTIQKFINLQDKPENQKVVTLRNTGERSAVLYNASSETMNTFLLLVKYFNFVTGAQWRCDCNVLNVTHALRQLMTQGSLTEEEGVVGGWMCGWPEELANQQRTLISLKDEDTYCELKESRNGSDSSCPHPCVCYVRAGVGSVIVDCRYTNMTSLPEEVPAATRELWLQNNSIGELQRRDYFGQLLVLKLSCNRLRVLPADVLRCLTSLQTLHLDNNWLTELPRELMSEVRQLREVRLKGNPFLCDCRTTWIKRWLLNSKAHVQDWPEVKCSAENAEGSVLVAVPDDDFVCKPPPPSLATLAIPVILPLTFAVLLLTFVLVAFVKRRQLKVLLYVHTGLHPFDLEKAGRQFLYDVTVCCDASTRDWILAHVIRRLEHERAYRVFFHSRDAFLGLSVSDNVRHCVKNSRRLVLVLGRGWQDDELLVVAARQGLAKCRKDLVHFLVVVLHQLSFKDVADKDVMQFIAKGRFVATEDKHFFKKLAYEMPHLPRRQSSAETFRRGHEAGNSNSSCDCACSDSGIMAAAAGNEHITFQEQPFAHVNQHDHFHHSFRSSAPSRPISPQSEAKQHEAVSSDMFLGRHIASIETADEDQLRKQRTDSAASSTDSGVTVTDSCATNTDSGVTVTDSCATSTDSGVTVTNPCASNTDSGVTVTDLCARNTDSGVTVTNPCASNTDSGVTVTDLCARNTDSGVTVTNPCGSNTDSGVTVTDLCARNTDSGVIVTNLRARNTDSGVIVTNLCDSTTDSGVTVTNPCASNTDSGVTVTDLCARNTDSGVIVTNPCGSNTDSGVTVTDLCARNTDSGVIVTNPCGSNTDSSVTVTDLCARNTDSGVIVTNPCARNTDSGVIGTNLCARNTDSGVIVTNLCARNTDSGVTVTDLCASNTDSGVIVTNPCGSNTDSGVTVTDLCARNTDSGVIVTNPCGSNTDSSVTVTDLCARNTDSGVIVTNPCARNTDSGVIGTNLCARNTDSGVIVTNLCARNTDSGVTVTDLCASNTDSGVIVTNPCASNRDSGVIVTNPCARNTDSGVIGTNLCARNTDSGVIVTNLCARNTDSGVTVTDLCASNTDSGVIVTNPCGSNTDSGVTVTDLCASNTDSGVIVTNPCASNRDSGVIVTNLCARNTDSGVIVTNLCARNTDSGVIVTNLCAGNTDFRSSYPAKDTDRIVNTTHSGVNNKFSSARRSNYGARVTRSRDSNTISSARNLESTACNPSSDGWAADSSACLTYSRTTHTLNSNMDSLFILVPRIVLRDDANTLPRPRVGVEELVAKTVFVWCSETDLEHTLLRIVAPLEVMGHRCVLKDRDFLVGLSIQENIVRAVDACRRAIFVLSSEAASCDWFLFAFHVTFDRGLRSRDQRVLFVRRGGLEVKGLEQDVQHAVQTTAGLCEDDPWFWPRLQRFVSCDFSDIC